MAQIPARVRAHPSLNRPISGRPVYELAVDRVWRFLCSVRAAIWEIAFLALLVLIGSLRGSSVPRWIANQLPPTAGLVDRWYAWDVFSSLVFLAILTLLAVAIAICTANRAPGIWASITRPTVSTTRGFLRNAETSASMSAAIPCQQLAAELSAALHNARYRVLLEERREEIHLYADRYRWGKLGTFPFHLALILVLVGGVVGGRWGFRDNEFIVPEGVSRAVGHGTNLRIRVDGFNEAYFETGMAEEYRSDLTVFDGDDQVAVGSITVNNPLTVDDTTIYQSGFGQAVHLRVADAASGVPLLDEVVPLGLYQAKANPDAPAAVLDVPPAGIRLTVIAPDTNAANRPELDQLNLRSGQMYLQARPLGGTERSAAAAESAIDQGGTVQLEGLAVTFVREQRFTALQVARNPGIPIFIAASLLLVGGLAVTFYFPHRRIRGIVQSTAAGATATLAPMARRDWSGQRVFADLVGEFERTLPISVERSFREHGRADRADPPGSGGLASAPFA